MSDNYNISYSYQQGSTTPTPDTPVEEPLVAFTNCETVKLDNDSVLLLNRDNGRQLTVTPEVATALSYCGNFQTLQGHADNLAATIPQLQGQAADIIKVLRMVNDAGLMTRADAIASRLVPAVTPEAELAPTRVVIITCDRPDALERLLDSVLQFGHPGRHNGLFVVDDSRDADNMRHNRELVSGFNRSSSRNMHYVGEEAQEKLLDALVLAQPNHEEGIRFLLDRKRWSAHKSYGLARSVSLLLSVGYRCIVLDDDVICRAVLPPAPGQGISFGSGANRELACFGSEHELMTQAVYTDDDPLTGHARCLGMNLAQSLRELGQGQLPQSTLETINATMLTTLRADSPILVTQCGSWGDPGTPGCSWFAHLGQESVERILSAPGGLSSTIQNRYYWLGRNRPNISKMAVMSQITGLDNTQLLPPYFPAYRGEDYLFAAMVLYLHPLSAVLDYNWSVPHLPIDARQGATPDSRSVSRGGLGLAARYLVECIDYEDGVAAQTRLDALALLLQDLGERHSASLLASFRAQLANEHAGELRQLKSQIQSAGAMGDPEWDGFLHRSMQAVATALQSPSSPTDMPEVDGLDEEALFKVLREGLGIFGKALAAWPGMREAAAVATADMLASDSLLP